MGWGEEHTLVTKKIQMYNEPSERTWENTGKRATPQNFIPQCQSTN